MTARVDQERLDALARETARELALEQRRDDRHELVTRFLNVMAFELNAATEHWRETAA